MADDSPSTLCDRQRANGCEPTGKPCDEDCVCAMETFVPPEPGDVREGPRP